MKLFFETENQALVFLLTVPIGMLLFFFLDGREEQGVWRFVMDLLSFCICGASLFMLFWGFGQEILRIYHLLGLVTGGMLYMKGMSRILLIIRAFFFGAQRGLQQETSFNR